MGGIIQRHRELKRRRKRKQKIAKLAKRSVKASPSEKAIIASKLRNMTPGAEIIIERLGLIAR